MALLDDSFQPMAYLSCALPVSTHFEVFASMVHSPFLVVEHPVYRLPSSNLALQTSFSSIFSVSNVLSPKHIGYQYTFNHLLPCHVKL